MSWRCHEWSEKERCYAPPAGIKATDVSGSNTEALRQLLDYNKACAFGITTIILECGICGDLKTTVVYGEATHE